MPLISVYLGEVIIQATAQHRVLFLRGREQRQAALIVLRLDAQLDHALESTGRLPRDVHLGHAVEFQRRLGAFKHLHNLCEDHKRLVMKFHLLAKQREIVVDLQMQVETLRDVLATEGARICRVGFLELAVTLELPAIDRPGLKINCIEVKRTPARLQAIVAPSKREVKGTSPLYTGAASGRVSVHPREDVSPPRAGLL